MRAMMEGVVLRGTGRRAQTPGYRVGGKTGTAQKIDPETRAYSQTDYIAGFAGFAPVNNPSVVIIVQLDSPVGQYHGGQVAAPVFVPVVTEALRFRDVPPSLPLPPAEAPSPLVPDEFLADFTRDPVEDLSAGEPPPTGMPADRLTIVVAAGMPVRSPRTETADASATPGSMGATRAAEKVNLLVAASVVPDFDGRTVREVAAQSSALGFQLQVQGSGSARRQWPEAGTPVYRGQQVRVEFRRSPPVRAGTP
jgi:cell division protein FtsI (penicillin-binding protein 3)